MGHALPVTPVAVELGTGTWQTILAALEKHLETSRPPVQENLDDPAHPKRIALTLEWIRSRLAAQDKSGTLETSPRAL